MSVPAQMWEYLVIQRNTHPWPWGEDRDEEGSIDWLNQLGDQGWELVNTISIVNNSYGRADAIRYIFKRPSP